MWLFVYCFESKIVVEAIRYRKAVWLISNFKTAMHQLSIARIFVANLPKQKVK